MKKAGSKMRIRIQGRQKLSPKTIVIYGTFSAAIILFLTVFFNVSDISEVKANAIEIKPVEDQVFKNDMALPAPEIRSEKNAGPNTIFIRKIRQSEITPQQTHE